MKRTYYQYWFSLPLEQESIAPPEPTIVQEEEDVFGSYDLPETFQTSTMDQSKEE